MIRKHFAGFAASALALAVSAQAFAGTVTTDGADIVIKTKGGLEVATTDKEFSFKLGGRLQADYGTFDGFYTRNGNNADAAYFRRAFLELSGTVYKDWKYVISYDLAHNAGNSDDGYFDEASVTYTGFNPVNIRVGRFDPDFGLEKATSSKWITAIERSAIYEIADWVNGHENGLGVQASSVIGNMAFMSGGVSAKDSNDTDGESVKQFNLRGVFAPMAEPGNVLHLGLNYANRGLDDVAADGRIRPRLTVRGVSTNGGNDAGTNGNRAVFGGFQGIAGDFDSDSAWGAELAYAMGPFSAQAEYLARKLKADRAGIEDIKANGYYAQLAYTLTGESRGYRLDGARFDAIKPSDKQLGAWEVFYRYDNIKIEDDNVTVATATREVGDTKAKLHTVGVNWYVNDVVKVAANYVKAETDKITNTAGDDDGDAFVMRVQYAF
ncbi:MULTISPECIES: OprO/OprP family phosphate-selective porin [Ectopseudomonas]|jgi:phosphate-selective porin OprO/OprP|uniref:OprO/OprP family phosphate-selective porin n=2 Tax=Ectopseudomonas TaxID=3236654 RepID=A0AA42QD09_ECTOL|nr:MULTISPECIES: OprO/OprP family phosphate-selective porin [Pseudomonas]EJO94952.1 phosphate-selective porin O and P [Pseudomonas mendocina DLHK]MDH1340334.1 OprO/OprP family phosphate-selective porin [Pseudomonas oleovorans]MDH1492030.1 OprO/OprP family phosphate-selective porin [Pseudomonas oleovorans]UTH37760.1 OprO/OprP family phosphate-selective porin [Pseudomonas sp. KHPS1]WGG22186.1 OprO/OprP family phosphate-selective porin [Pseudomonas oleovorans]